MKSKKKAWMEMCDRKYMFGPNMPKKGQQEKIFFGTLKKGQLPTLFM